MTDPLDRAEASARRLDEWRTQLHKLSAGSVPEIAEVSFLGRELRAAATVAAMAELEAILRDMLVDIGLVISSRGIEVRRLLPCLRSLAAHSTFVSMSSTADAEKHWTQRLLVTSLEFSSAHAAMPTRVVKGPQPPLDGRTIQPHHLFTVWRVLGLTDPIPSASVVASLKKLTQIRNDVAHRNVDIAQVFSEAGRTSVEIATYIDDVTLLILNVGSEWSSYIANESFLTPTP